MAKTQLSLNALFVVLIFPVVRILIISLVFALVTPLAELGLLVEGVEYSPPMDLAAFYAMSYEGQQEWLKDHSHTITGSNLLLSRIDDKHFGKQEYPL
jgi:hypothetical protein